MSRHEKLRIARPVPAGTLDDFHIPNPVQTNIFLQKPEWFGRRFKCVYTPVADAREGEPKGVISEVCPDIGHNAVRREKSGLKEDIVQHSENFRIP
jgi:hypothetical protein